MQDDNNKNMILASVLSMLVLLMWFYFFPQEQPQVPAKDQLALSNTGDVVAPSAGGVVATAQLLQLQLLKHAK